MGEAAMVGFTGSRRLPKIFEPLVHCIVDAVARSGRRILVGDAPGLDAMVQARCRAMNPVYPHIRIDHDAPCPVCKGNGHVPLELRDQGRDAKEFPGCEHCGNTGCRFGIGKEAFVRRSMQLVERLCRSGEGRGIIGFPDRPCPKPIRPLARWVSGEIPSGTWSTLALAAGMGLPTFVVPCVTDGNLEAFVPKDEWSPSGTFQNAGAREPWSRAFRFTLSTGIFLCSRNSR